MRKVSALSLYKFYLPTSKQSFPMLITLFIVLVLPPLMQVQFTTSTSHRFKVIERIHLYPNEIKQQ